MKDPLLPHLVEMQSWQQESELVFTFQVAPPEEYGSFRAGQFNMLYLAGMGESAISISGDPADRNHLTHTVRAVGNVTRALHGLRPPARIGLRGPFGRGWPLAAAEGRELLLMAGGIGLAPLRPVLFQALAAPERYQRVTLLLGARSPEEILYSEQLLRWKSDAGLQFLATVDVASAAWRGDVGVITDLVQRAAINPQQTVAMVCGPEIMLRFCARRLRELGVASDAIHVSLERHMQCGTGFCGHCQLGPYFLCKDGPVFAYPAVEPYLMTQEF